MPKAKNAPNNTISITNRRTQVAEEQARQEATMTPARDDAIKLAAAKPEAPALKAVAEQPKSYPPGPTATVRSTPGTLTASEVLSAAWAADEWKGDFTVPGLGAGNVRIGRQSGRQWDAENQAHDVDRVLFLVDGNLIDRQGFEYGIARAALVIGAQGLNSEAREYPLTSATQDGYVSYTRSGGSSWVHEKKYLACTITSDELRRLLGHAPGLSFYVRLEMKDQRTLFINRDGQAFCNFELPATEISAHA